MKRTDVHRPSAIIPSEYTWVAQEVAPIFSLGDALFIQAERERIRAHMARTGGTYSQHAHGGNCMVCGNPNAIYTQIFYHEPTNAYVRMGTDCARKCDMGMDFGAIALFRRNVADARKNVAGKAKAAALLADLGLDEAWEIYSEAPQESDRWEERTIRDIVAKMVKYGALSEKQTAFLKNLVAKIPLREQLAAQRAAEAAAAAPAPTGRVTVTGVILTVKSQESDFGSTLKMLVKATEGWKLWVTVPSAAMGTAGRLSGRTITVAATVTPSKDDPKFAFGKRPTLISMSDAPEVATA